MEARGFLGRGIQHTKLRSLLDTDSERYAFEPAIGLCINRKSVQMQVAEILSDLASLGVCDPVAALGLISIRPCLISKSCIDLSTQSSTAARSTDDPDLIRAKDLVHLHYSVKVSHSDGYLGHGLSEGRDAVSRAFRGSDKLDRI